jgi:iron complex transport system ATP-binding protein
MQDNASVISCDSLTVTIRDRILVRQLNLEIARGAFVCVLGTNGAGKTLTLHTLAGLRSPHSGHVSLAGDLLTKLPRKEIARRLGLLLQIHEDAFPISVMDTVLMGRYPHGGLWQWPDETDRNQVRQALHSLDLHDIENRSVSSLSGGERERVALATVIVQDPDIWLLDEPTNHLDPHHQLIVLDHLRKLAGEGRTIITTVHNPALAMRYADFALLLYGDGNWEFGRAAELLEPARLESMYKTPFDYYRNETGTRTALLPA